MILEIVAIILSFISIALASWAIYDTRRVNKETSDFLIKIKTYSENINDRAMGWLEQLIFSGKDAAGSPKLKKESDQTKTARQTEITKSDLLNFLYKYKGATFEEIIQDLKISYATAKALIIGMRSFVNTYQDVKGKTIYYLPETKKEAEQKYPKPIAKAIDVKDFPF